MLKSQYLHLHFRNISDEIQKQNYLVLFSCVHSVIKFYLFFLFLSAFLFVCLYIVFLYTF